MASFHKRKWKTSCRKTPRIKLTFLMTFSILNLHDMHTLLSGIDYEFGNNAANVFA